jgi:mono/diheme cytochrome c family protein
MRSALILLAICVASPAAAQAPKKGPIAVIAGAQQAERMKLAASAYARHCAGCHGEKGDGKGPASEFLNPKPRDFTRGLYKFRTTPWGTPPTDDDIYRTITHGIPGTSMPSWHLLSELERRALVEYVKTFSDVFEDEASFEPPIAVPHPPAALATVENVRLGRAAYRVIGCVQCHGQTAAGDGPSAAELKDDWGHPIQPTSFARGVLRGGRTPRDIYRSIATGISGTPMPAFAASLAEPKIWALVAYLREVAKNGADPSPNDVAPECEVWDTCAEEPAAGRN